MFVKAFDEEMNGVRVNVIEVDGNFAEVGQKKGKIRGAGDDGAGVGDLFSAGSNGFARGAVGFLRAG